ncbi:uncharacterized protein N7482_008794 [Penicillium canariense]|uniref:Glycoprotease family protein n=1 Tax=Penicillium canariense TaxID=189055 RepID=A0A9W9LIP6_9EURO|nr:uncharacterized protein N7482_008794 [Penicillium canariense]KAJ5157694.1 hypothetical protein N7482_008794 [Penicillium canariense]
MPSTQHKQPDLQVPVAPTFPLSSPISEEISSPSCSSAEDKDLERSRPFDFLVNAAKHKVEHKSGRDGNRSPNLSQRDRHDRHRRLSIRGITKKKKDAGKPVGLNLVTDFSLAGPPKYNTENASAPFVDLNDLKLLAKDRAKERSAQKVTISTDLEGVPDTTTHSNTSKKRASFHQLPEETRRIQCATGNPFLDPKLDNSFLDRFDHGLSPSDRHVMIGLSVPRHESSQHAKEIDSAGTPLTPSIIVTPAREDAPWSTSSPEYLKPRATSSIYSQPTPRLWQNESDIPPVPAIPAEHFAAKKQTMDSDFLRAHLAAMTRKRRSMSAETIIEDDTPDREHPHESLDDDDKTLLTRLSVNTQASRPESQGWWTYLLSPLLGKKSPLSPSFLRSNASVAPATKGTHREGWEKEVSCFSPETPESAVPSQWQENKKSLDQSRSLENNEDPATSTKKQMTASMIFGGQPIQGEAAEYYQACAHELFSKTPYFECCNHICSITPAAVIAAAMAAQLDADKGETRDRGLIFAEAHPQEKDRSVPASTMTENKNLLIDIDSPTGEGSKGIEHSKEISSPKSTTSSDSWASSISDDYGHEKALPEPPQSTSRGVVPEPPAEPQIHPPPAGVPVCEPAPIPQAFMPEPPPPGPVPVAPAVMPEPPPPIQAPPPQIINTISPPVNNIHYAAQPVAMPPEPVPMERAAPQYAPVFPPANEPPRMEPMPHEQSRGMDEWPKVPPPAAYNPAHQASTPAAPVPIPMGGPPPGSDLPQQHHVPPSNSNEPISPAFQRAAGGPGAIPMNPMNDVHAPAPAYSQFPREGAALPPRYALHPAPGAALMNPTGERGPMEARRQRLEREDAIGRKVGGFWRGRGCFSKKGCFGRPGREGRTKRRWYFGICTLFLIIVILAIVLATTLTRKGDTTPVQSQWLNLTGYPPMPTGISTVAGAEPQVEKSSCIKPSSLWSCALPKSQQSDNKPYPADEPNFRIEIRFRNGTYANSTATVSTTSTSKARRADANSWDPSPSPPSIAEQTFLGNTTDGSAVPYAGEDTPFYLTFLSPVQITSSTLFRRATTNNTTTFPNLTAVIPAPSENSDSTAAAATLYPLPESQPVRLYNRGKDTEHYGFYTYFDKSIFLASRAPLNGSTTDSSPIDTTGGAAAADAVARCTWSQTRFLVQIWTQPSKLGYALLSPSNKNDTGTSTSTSSTATPTSTSSTATSSSSATDFTQPGSFPYPITITIDRHGGAEKQKLVYCYGIESDQHYNITDRKLQLEDRGFGGTLVNPASGIFDDLEGGDSGSNSSVYGGVDGGTGGCECQWTNWIARS